MGERWLGKRVGKKTVVAYFTVVFRHLPKGTEENHKKPPDVTLKTQSPTTTRKPLHAQNNGTNSNIEFLQPYPVAGAESLLEIGTGKFQLFCPRWAFVTDNHYLCPETVLQVGALLSYSVHTCQDTHC
jgi:hypothetical protein